MRVDVHAHSCPLTLNELLLKVACVQRTRGIQRMVLSLGNTPPYYEQQRTAQQVAQGCNDIYVDLHTRHPARFNVFIGVPVPHVDAALEELDRGLSLPGVVGVGLGTVTFLHPVGIGGGPNSDDFALA